MAELEMRLFLSQVGIFHLSVYLSVCLSVCLTDPLLYHVNHLSFFTQVCQNFWVESLNEVQPIITSLVVPDKEVELRFAER